MYTTIREVMAREQTRQGTNTPNPMLVSPEDLQQQQMEQEQKSMMMPGQSSIQPSQALPMHEVSAEPQKYPVEHAQQLHSFLKNAAGGPPTGFVTAKPEDHAIAKELAKSGHLQHHGSRPGGAGGGIVHHWSMTPKGLAAVGQGTGAKKPGMPGAGGARPGMGGPMGMAKKPGGMGGAQVNVEKNANWLRKK